MTTYEIENYVSNDEKLKQEIEKLESSNKYTILAKGSTGLGGTTYFIVRDTDIPQIIVIHSKSILHDKFTQLKKDNKFFLYGGSQDRFEDFITYPSNNKTLCLTPEQFEIHKLHIQKDWKLFIDEIDSCSENISFREDIEKLLIASMRFNTIVVSSATFTIIKDKFRDIPIDNPAGIRIVKKGQKPIYYNIHRITKQTRKYLESIIIGNTRERPLLIFTNETSLIESFATRVYVKLLVGDTMKRKTKIRKKAIEISDIDWDDTDQVIFMSSRYFTGVDVMFKECDVVVISNPRSSSKLISHNMMRQIFGRIRKRLRNADIIIDNSKPIKLDEIEIQTKSFEECETKIDTLFETSNFMGVDVVSKHYEILRENLTEYNQWVVRSCLEDKLKKDNNMLVNDTNTISRIDFKPPKRSLHKEVNTLIDHNDIMELTIDLEKIRQGLDNKYDKDTIGYSLKKHWLPYFISYVCLYDGVCLSDIVSQITYEPLMIYDFNQYMKKSQVDIKYKTKWKSFIGWYKAYLNKPKKRDNKSLLSSSRIIGKYRKKERVLLEWKYTSEELELLIMESYPRTDLYKDILNNMKPFEDLKSYREEIIDRTLEELSSTIKIRKEISQKIKERVSEDIRNYKNKSNTSNGGKLPSRSIQTPYIKIMHLFEELINGSVNNFAGKEIDNRIYNSWTNISKKSLHFIRNEHPRRFLSLDVNSAYVRFVDINLSTNVYKEVYSNIQKHYKCTRDEAKIKFNTFLNNGKNIDGNDYRIRKAREFFKIASNGVWTEKLDDLISIITQRNETGDTVKYNIPFLRFSLIEKKVIERMSSKLSVIYYNDDVKLKFEKCKRKSQPIMIKPIIRKHDELIIDTLYMKDLHDDEKERWRYCEYKDEDGNTFDIEFSLDYL